MDRISLSLRLTDGWPNRAEEDVFDRRRDDEGEKIQNVRESAISREDAVERRKVWATSLPPQRHSESTTAAPFIHHYRRRDIIN